MSPPPSGLPPADYSLGPDSQPQPGVPKGTVTRHVLAPGKFFPGTPHNYQVYVPAQHDAGRPMPFMIFLDGSGYAGDNVRVPVVLDNLIARRDAAADDRDLHRSRRDAGAVRCRRRIATSASSSTTR